MSASSHPPNIKMDLAPNHPYQAEEDIPPFPANVDIPELDPELKLPETKGEYSDLLLGCATFGYGVYDSPEHVRTVEPLKIVGMALEAGIGGFDTSPHYHPSETILGHALATLRDRFPRESYKLLTKAGKYGPRLKDHVYDPAVIRASVERSLKRLQTDYLDVVYLHDCEFLSSFPFPMPKGNHSLAERSEAEQSEALGASAAAPSATTPSATGTAGATSDSKADTKSSADSGDPAAEHSTSKAEAWGLVEPYEPRGDGDRLVLAAFAELRALQREGKIRACGLAGYPLPTLLRFCRLIRAQTGQPVDVVQNYSHFTLQNSTLEEYLPLFTAAGVGQVINASPLSMGLLTTQGPPWWHPAVYVDELRTSAREAAEFCRAQGGSIEEEALRFGYRRLTMGRPRAQPEDGTGATTEGEAGEGREGKKGDGEPKGVAEEEKVVPCVVGCSTLPQLLQTLETFKRVREGEAESELGRKVRNLLRERGALGVSWQKPAPEEMV